MMGFDGNCQLFIEQIMRVVLVRQVHTECVVSRSPAQVNGHCLVRGGTGAGDLEGCEARHILCEPDSSASHETMAVVPLSCEK